MYGMERGCREVVVVVRGSRRCVFLVYRICTCVCDVCCALGFQRCSCRVLCFVHVQKGISFYVGFLGVLTSLASIVL